MLLALVGLAPGGHPSLLSGTVDPRLQRRPSGGVRVTPTRSTRPLAVRPHRAPRAPYSPSSLTVSSHNWFSHMSLMSAVVNSPSFFSRIHRSHLRITRGHVLRINSLPAMTLRGT